MATNEEVVHLADGGGSHLTKIEKAFPVICRAEICLKVNCDSAGSERGVREIAYVNKASGGVGATWECPSSG